MTGLSAVIGSWKIIDMRAPRSSRRRSSPAASRFSPSSRILPPETGSVFGRSPMIVCAITLLPEPDSPTRHRISSFSTSNETLRAQTAYFGLERRSAEATTLREQATALLAAGRAVVGLGDVNDVPKAATTEILYGPPGSQP